MVRYHTHNYCRWEVIYGSGNLQNIWSIKLQDFLANLVGKVILGRKPLTHIKSKKSPNFSLSWICKRFILKSPTIKPWDIFLEILSTIGEKSSMNTSILCIIIVVFRRTINIAKVNLFIQLLTKDINKKSLPKKMHCYAYLLFCKKNHHEYR